MKRIFAFIVSLIGVFFLVIAARVAIWPPKGDSGIDMVLGSILLSIIPFLLAGWLFKSSLKKAGEITRNVHEENDTF